MNNKNNHSTFLIIAGLLFFIDAIYDIAINFDWYIGSFSYYKLSAWLWAISSILVAIGLFINSRKLIASGAVVLIISWLIQLIVAVTLSCPTAGNIISKALLVIIGILMLILSQKRGHAALSLGIVMAAIVFVQFFVYALDSVARLNDEYSLHHWTLGDYITLRSVVPRIIWMAKYIFAGMALSVDGEAQAAYVSAPTIQASSDDIVEKLTKLKALLDMGAITSEEFNIKKSQMLGYENFTNVSSENSAEQGCFCPACGNTIAQGQTACPSCGQEITW